MTTGGKTQCRGWLKIFGALGAVGTAPKVVIKELQLCY